MPNILDYLGFGVVGLLMIGTGFVMVWYANYIQKFYIKTILVIVGGLLIPFGIIAIGLGPILMQTLMK